MLVICMTLARQSDSRSLNDLSVDTTISAVEDLFGKVVSDLQSDITIANGKISGTSKYVADYTAAGFDADSHNFLALHATAEDGATITVELIGGTSGAVTLDSDGICVLAVSEDTTAVKFVATNGAEVETKVYELDLTLNES